MALPLVPSSATMSSGWLTMVMTPGSGSLTSTTSVSAVAPSSAVITHLYCWPRRAAVTGTVIVAVLLPSMPEAFQSVPFTGLKYHW